MKKFYSFVAALVVAMVMLVSCGGNMAFKGELENAKTALEKKDWAAVEQVCNTISNGKDKATSMDLALAFLYKEQVYANKYQEAVAAGNTVNADDYIAGFEGALQLLDAAKAKSDYHGTVSALKVLGSDIAQYETAAKQSIENFKNAAAQAQAQAQAEAADGEGEGEEEGE